ncbi:MAG: DUF1501 domain-containing protein [Planctomycetales bacterium]
MRPDSSPAHRRLSRRAFLEVGGAAFGGLTLADLLRAEAATGATASRKSVILVHLDGGPPQQDMIDLKPAAPVEIRGEFAPIDTSLAGFRICELLPRLAAMADRFAWVRSLVNSAGAHDAFQCQTGFRSQDLASFGGRPAMGSVVAKLAGRSTDVAPPFVDLMQGRALVRDSARPGFLGPTFKPFRPDLDELFARPLEPGMVGELSRKGAEHRVSLVLNESLDPGRLEDRNSLMRGLDQLRRDVDASGMMDAMDSFSRQAVSILTSGRFAEALDLSRVPEAELARYASGVRETADWFRYNDRPNATLKFLLARRLIEAGVRVVSLSISDFDTHGNNFRRMRQILPLFDHGLSALVADLEERGLLDDVSIVCWGEFGRTPKINNNAGRDHWPQVAPAILAGGGLKVGQVIGATDRLAATATERPVTHKDIFATVYRKLGIDPQKTTVTDPTGRPQFLLDEGEPIAEL